MAKKIKSIPHISKTKYSLALFDNEFQSVSDTVRFTGKQISWIVFGLSLFAAIVTILLLIFTPLKTLLPGYPTHKERIEMQQYAHKIDTLESKIKRWEVYALNMDSIIAGKPPIEEMGEMDTIPANQLKGKRLTPSGVELELRAMYEEENKTKLSSGAKVSPTASQTSLDGMHLYPPVRGVIKSKFNPRDNKFEIAIESTPGQLISAMLDGTIISSFWTYEKGFIIQIQHSNNLTSIYKNNARCFKRVGAQVKTGEVIGVANDPKPGQKNTLVEFEIWYNGAPVDPQTYILF
jgi:murein DD-endopeptidase MepM/ murein hydrolase activator NlpD